MLPWTITELDKIAKECKAMVTRRAALSGTVAIIPVPGADLMADISMLARLIPKINDRFGLSEKQIANLSTENKTFLYSVISSVGSSFIGKAVTRSLITQVLRKLGVRYSAKLGTKYVPLIGSAVAGIMSFGIMKYLGNSHVDDCYRVAKQIIESNQQLEASQSKLIPLPVPK